MTLTLSNVINPSPYHFVQFGKKGIGLLFFFDNFDDDLEFFRKPQHL